MRARSELVAQLTRAGFVLLRQNGHQIWECPCGHTQITVPTTPGYGRSTWNTNSKIKRTLKVCARRKANA